MAVNSESYTGKYDKKKLLGKGTFGEAWLVISRASGKSYVMKEMCTGGWDEKEKELSMNEVNILASCNHVNIVRYAGAYIVKKNLSSERILIIMEFCDAGDLSIIIKNQKEKVKQFFKEEDVLIWFVQMVFGLQYIHKKNILHRDLKTQNIFVTSQNLIKIGDFGISKSLSHTLDLATTAIGTPHYLSPEICRRKPYNHKSDMWSLGCVLYEMCALELAFPADNFMSLVHAICKGQYKPVAPHYSRKVADLVQVLLRPVPDRRPSAEMLLTASKLEVEVKQYLSYVNTLRNGEEPKPRLSSQSSLHRNGSTSSQDGGYGTGQIEPDREGEKTEI